MRRREGKKSCDLPVIRLDLSILNEGLIRVRYNGYSDGIGSTHEMRGVRVRVSVRGDCIGDEIGRRAVN